MLNSFLIKHYFNAGHFTLKVPQNAQEKDICDCGLWFLHLVVAKALQKLLMFLVVQKSDILVLILYGLKQFTA